MRTINLMSALLLAAAALVPASGVARPAVSPATEFSAQSRAASCESDRKACMAASVQTGNFGSRYVPPDAVAQCQAAYRACIGRR